MKAEIVVQDKKNLTELEKEKLTKEQKEMIATAEDILNVVKGTISRKHFMLEPFLQIFQYVPVEEEILLETDGIHLFYQPEKLLKKLENRELPVIEAELMHLLCHGILGHFRKRTQMDDKEVADAVLDYEAEDFAKKMEWKKEDAQRMDMQKFFRKEDIDKFNSLDVSELYYSAKEKKSVSYFFQEWKNNFLKKDDHEIWDRMAEKRYHLDVDEETAGEEELFPMDGEDMQREKENPFFGGKGKSSKNGADAWEEKWKLVFGKEGKSSKDAYGQLLPSGNQGAGSGGGNEQTLVTAAKENGKSYSDLLRQFWREKEVFREREDTIDRMLYTYSLDLYGDVALIEPEECTELRQLNTVVLAIDTSGSCSGEVSERFLREIKNIFRDLSSDIRFEQIILFQCDAKIQKEEYFLSAEEFQKKNNYEMFGFGGTDFCPVFQRIEELKKEKNLTIDCLLYLTDGCGDYPEKKPDYPVFFVLTERDEWHMGQIPKWIRKLYLS